MKKLFFALAMLLAASPAGAQVSRGAKIPAEGSYELSAVEVIPQVKNARELVEAMENTYPDSLRDAGIGGEVHVRMRVDAAGVPHDMVVSSSTRPEFDALTLAAVAKLRFTPAQVGGKPVSVWVELPIHWSVF